MMPFSHVFARTIISACLLVAVVGCRKDPLEQARSLHFKKGDRALAEKMAEGAIRVHAKEKRYADALPLWLGVARADASWWLPYYQLACLHALLGKPTESVEFLRLALEAEKSPKMLSWMQSDSDLNAVRKLPEFRKLLTQNESFRRLVGRWSDPDADSLGRLPPPYNSYARAGYQTLNFAADGRYRADGTSGALYGTFSAAATQVTITLSRAVTEKHVFEGHMVGGETALSKSFSMPYIVLPVPGKNRRAFLLCVDWPENGPSSPTGGYKECYQKD